MKIILKNCEGNNVHTFCIKVNHIDCEKDTYEVIKESVTGPLNRDIQLINQSGCIQVLTGITNNKMSLFMGSLNKVDLINYTVTKSIPLRVLMCKDLAFFAAVIGKVNMSGKLCIWCQFRPTEWSTCNHTHGAG